MRSAAVFDEGGGGLSKIPYLFSSSFSLIFSSISLPPTCFFFLFAAAPQSCLTLTADAHCSGK